MALPVVRRWNPWSDLLNLQEEMNRLFESTMGVETRAPLLGTEFIPPVDVVRDKDNVVVKVDLPGMKKEDLDISVLHNALILRGTKKQEGETEQQSIHRRERFFGTFERVIDLPATVDVEKIKATFTDGVLQITAPLREEARPRQIAVDVK